MAKTFKSTESKGAPSQEEIAKRAYEIFERNGCKPGQDMANWLSAESELMNERGMARGHSPGTQPAKGISRDATQRR